MTPEPRLTMSEVTRHASAVLDREIGRKRVYDWQRQGLLKPSFRAKRARKEQGRPKRNYSVADVVTAVVLSTLIDDLGFHDDDLHGAARILRRADADELRRAAILAVRTKLGFLRHVLVENLDLGADEVAAGLGVSGASGNGYALVAALQANGRLVDDRYMTLHDACEVVWQALRDRALLANPEGESPS